MLLSFLVGEAEGEALCWLGVGGTEWCVGEAEGVSEGDEWPPVGEADGVSEAEGVGVTALPLGETDGDDDGVGEGEAPMLGEAEGLGVAEAWLGEADGDSCPLGEAEGEGDGSGREGTPGTTRVKDALGCGDDSTQVSPRSWDSASTPVLGCSGYEPAASRIPPRSQ